MESRDSTVNVIGEFLSFTLQLLWSVPWRLAWQWICFTISIFFFYVYFFFIFFYSSIYHLARMMVLDIFLFNRTTRFSDSNCLPLPLYRTMSSLFKPRASTEFHKYKSAYLSNNLASALNVLCFKLELLDKHM